MAVPQIEVSADEPKTVANSIGMQLVEVPAGEFTMGTDDDRDLKAAHPKSIDPDAGDEKPTLRVKISRPMLVGVHEVTVGRFRAFVEATGYRTDAETSGGARTLDMEAKSEVDRFPKRPERNWRDPGFPQTDEHPVTCVSWHDAVAFCQWLSEKEGATYRLPTEAEWEYACRAGTDTYYSCGNSPDDVYHYGNVADAALYAVYPEAVIRQRIAALEPSQGDGHVFTAPVGKFAANGFGLFDVHGNVWEWCDDRYDELRYPQLGKTVGREKGYQKQQRPIVDPQGPPPTDRHQHGDWRVMRGGSWYVSPVNCRSAVRAYAEAHDAYSYIGFRIVREIE
jgi:sulfatase modifying factor 1